MQSISFYLRYLLFFSLFLSLQLFALDFPAKPSNYVTDLGGYLTPAQEEILNEKFANYSKESGNLLYVLIAKSSENRDFTQLTHEIAEKWGLGSNGRDNSIFLALYIEDKKARFEVGYSLKEYVTEGIATHIRTLEMNPLLEKGKYFEAIDNGSEALILATLGTYTNTEIDDMDGDGGWAPYSELIIPFIIMSIFTIIFLFVQGYFILLNIPSLQVKSTFKKRIFISVIVMYLIVFSIFFYNALIGVLTHNNINIGIAIVMMFPAAFGMAITIAVSENILATNYSSKGKKLRINRKPFSSGNNHALDSNWSTGNSFDQEITTFGGGGSGGSW
jgi:uncharacterized protein